MNGCSVVKHKGSVFGSVRGGVTIVNRKWFLTREWATNHERDPHAPIHNCRSSLHLLSDIFVYCSKIRVMVYFESITHFECVSVFVPV